MTPIDKSHWQAVSPLLDELLDADASARERRLAEIAQQQPQLADELRGLLAEHAAVDRDGFLAGNVSTPLSQATLAGAVVDRYMLDRQLGEGGMGTVWLAHRSDGRFEGEVAIKFLSVPAIGPVGLQRFEREGHVLARLKHPNIAHLLDAGVTGGGQPYLVLEYVQGEPLDRWCESRALGIEQRIELFLQVLDAVAHAHGKLILHRDIKPSNILVTDEGRVKLLDFGIAKLLDDEGAPAQESEVTRMAGRAFTLDYAAPEQIQGAEVTTATDVYSLGVLLYVVLTGQHPTAGDGLTPAERLRALVDTEPKRPSAVVAKTLPRDNATQSRVDRVRALRGDLDNIIAKALKKSPAERYATVDALAQDLRRYLNDEPVTARPDALGYRLRKFLVRHAWSVAGAALVLTAVVAAAIVSIVQAHEARLQRDRALAMSARNAAVVDFVNGMLTEVAPGDRPIPVSELLERSRALLMGDDADPEHQAAILDLMAEYYLSAGKAQEAQPLFERALQLTATSTDPALRATVLCNSGHAMALANRLDEAIRTIERGIELSRVDPLAAARCLQKRAYIAHNFNDPEGAIRYTTAAQRSLQAAHVRKPDQEASLVSDLAYAHYLSGHTAEADRYYAQALEQYAKIGRAESPATFSIRNNWGIASFAAGDNRRALENYEEALRIAKEREPDADPPSYLLTNRALALASLGRYGEAMQAFDEALAAALRANNVAAILHGLVNRAGTQLMMGNVDLATKELAAIERQYGAAIPPDSVPAVTIGYIKGRIAAARGERERALAHLTTTIEFFDKRGMAVAPVTRALNARAEVQMKSAEFDAARRDARRALEISRKLQGAKPYSSLTGQSLLQVAEIESAAGDRRIAERSAREAIDHLSQTLGDQHPDTIRARALLSRPSV